MAQMFLAASLIACLLSSANAGDDVLPWPADWAPWPVTVESLYFFKVSPLSKAPAHPPQYAQADLPQWPFLGGEGFLIIAKYSDSPAGPYSELVYMPGRYRIGRCSREFYSVSRIWVDSPVALEAGRRVWGFPKEMANFKWSKNATTESVVASNAETGRIMLTADVLLAPVPGAKIPRWMFKALSALTEVQWPILDPKDKRSRADPWSSALGRGSSGAAAAYDSAAGATEGQGGSSSSGMRLAGITSSTSTDNIPLSTYKLATLWFADVPRLSVAKAVSVKMDPEEFTGHKDEKFMVSAYPVRTPPGARAAIMKPQKLSPEAC